MLKISKLGQKVNINIENKQINNCSKHRFLMRKSKLMIAKTTINTENLQINHYCKERFTLRLSNPIIVKTNINDTNKQINDWLKTSLFRTKQLVIAELNINAKRHELIIIN